MSITRFHPTDGRSLANESRAQVGIRAPLAKSFFHLGRRAVSALVASASALCALPAIGADLTSTWSAATSGNWNVDGNWINAPALGGFPNNGNGGVATYDAVISAAGSAYTVTLGTSITLEDLTLSSANATLNHTAGTFTAAGAIAISAGAYQLNGGTISNTVINLSGTGSLVIGASSNNTLLTGAMVNGDLTLNASTARTKIAGGTTFNTAHLAGSVSELGFATGQTLTGTILFEGASTSGRFVAMNGSAGSFTIDATGVIRTAAGFAGSAQIGAGSSFGGNMTLLNQGLISSQTSGRTVTVKALSLTNEGIAEAINGATLEITSTNWSNASGATLRALNGSTLSLSGAWSNSGALTIDNSTLNLGGTFTTNGLNLAGFTRTGGTVNLTGTLTNTGNTLTLNSATGPWVLNGGTINGGTLAFADGQTLVIGANSNNTQLNGVMVNGDLTLNTSSARTKIAGGTTFTTAHLAANVSELGFAPGQTLAGTILFEGAPTGGRFVAMNGTAGDFTIGATGVIRTQTGLGGNVQIGAGSNFSGNMTLFNQGLISSQTSGRTVTVNALSLSNEGIIEAINGATLDITSTNWSNAVGATLRALNGSTLNLSGAWSNSGALTIDNSTVNLGGTFTTAGLNLAGFTRTGGTVNLTGTLTNTASTLTFNNATGTWVLNNGTINGGTLVFADGQSLLMGPSSTNLLNGVTVNGDLTLNISSARTRISGITTFGTAHLSGNVAELGFAPGQTLANTILFEGAPTGGRLVAMNGANGNFTIGATGVIRTAPGFAGNGQIGNGANFGGNMTLLNQGLISSQTSGRTVTVNALSFTNEGIVEAINGATLDITSTNWSNAAGGTLRALNGSTLSLSGAWSNSGALTIDSSTLNLGGTFSTTGLNLAGFTRTAGTVNLTGTLTNAGNTLTLNTATGSWVLNGGTINGGTLAFADSQNLSFGSNGANLLSGVTVNGDLIFNLSSARTKISGGTTFNTAHLSGNVSELGFATGQTLTGTILFEGSPTGARSVAMNGTAGSFTIGPTGVIRTETGFAGSAQIGTGSNFGGNMMLLNQGLISSQTSGRTLTVNPTSFTNSGTVEAINGGILNVSGLTGNLGTAIVSGAGSQISFDGTNYVNNQTLTVGAGTTATFNGSYSSSGAINLSSGTLNLGGTFTTAGLGTFTNSGGTVNLIGTLNNAGSTLTLDATTGSWTLLGGTVSGGTLAFADGQSLLLGAHNGNLLTGATVNGDLTLGISSGRVKIAGGTTFNTAHLAASASSLGFAPGQTLNGTILFEGAGTGGRIVEMNGANGSLTIGETGVIRTAAGFAGSGQIGGSFQFGGNMTLLNQGLISSQTSGRTVTVMPTSFTNTGTVEAINGGTLNVSGLNGNLGTAIVSGAGSQISFDGTNYVNNQTLTVGAGATATFNGTWTNTSAMNVTNGALTLTGTWSSIGTLSIDNSTLNLGGAFTLAGLNLPGFTRVGGTVNLTGTLTNTASTLTLNNATGSWNLFGGTINGGTLAFADGQTLLIGIANNNLLTGVTVNGDLTVSAISARVKIAGGTTFNTAHLAGASTSIGFAPGQTFNNTILLEGPVSGTRAVEMNGTNGNFTIGAAGVIRTTPDFAGVGQIGGGLQFGGNMTLLNQGLISSQTSGRTVTINPATSFTNAGTIEAINGAVLSIPNGYTQSSGATRVNNGTINSTTINMTAGTLEGSGTINATVNSSGIINLNADGTIAGPLNATGGSWIGQGIVTGLTSASVGTFTIGSGAHLHANGNLNVTGVGTIAAASATAKITGNVSYLSSSNSNFGGILAGAGKTVTMNNAAATFTLAGANTYTGATTVTAGILKAGITSVAGASGAFGRNSPVTMANVASALLDITGFDTQIGSLSGGGTSGGNVTLGAATLTFAGTNTSPTVFSGKISGSGDTNKIGPGTQTFNGTNAYTGRTTIGQGTLRLDFSTLAPPTNILNSAAALTLGGGTLSVLGKTGAAVATAQTLGDLTLGEHRFSTIVLDPNNSGTGGTTLTLGNAWTRNPGSTLLIDHSATNTGTRRTRTLSAITGTGGAGPNGILGYALVKDSGGTGFAVQDGSFNLIRNTVAGTVLTSSNSVAVTTTTDFTTVPTDPGYSGGTLTLDNVAHAANTLSINTTGGGTLNLGGASGVLALTSNALLVQGTGNYTIQNGALGASDSEVIVHQLAAGTLTISSAISGGAGALTKDGSGTLALTGTQNYATLTATGGTTNLQMPLGTGTSTIHANARVNITTSQTLSALNIGPTGVVALGTTAGAPLVENDDFDVEEIRGNEPAFSPSDEPSQVPFAGESSAQAVPEPRFAGLCLGGIVMLLAGRRRSTRKII